MFYDFNENPFYGMTTPTHILPIMIYLTDEEWSEFRRYYPNVLSFTCDRYKMNSEDELAPEFGDTTNFGDAIRWLLKLKGSEVEVIGNLK